MGLQKCGLNMNDRQKELQPHGTIAFPCAAYESRHGSKTSDAIAWHWHEELEIIYLKEGTMKLQIPASEYKIRKGDLIILNGNVLHYAVGAPDCELCSIVFSPFLLTGNSSTVFYTKYIQPLLSCAHFTMLQNTEADIVNSFLTAFNALRDDSFAYEFTAREQLSKIMLRLYQHLEKHLYIQDRGNNTNIQRTAKMLEYIQTHYSETITLQTIAQSANLGERECLRCFKRTIGESPIQYLLKYRLMQSASMLLAKPSDDIAEIAAACGFDYPSYYSKQFKRFYQCTPKDYRRLHG